MKNRSLGLAFLVLGLQVFLQRSTHAQATVSGVLTEKASGEVVIGASVTAQPEGNTEKKSVRGAVTNKFGFFSIPGLQPGTYTVAVRALGFAAYRKSVTLTGEALRIDIPLEREDVRGQEVIVEGTKDAPTRSISAVDVRTDFIQHLPSLGGESDIFRALQLMPGVKSVSEISSGLYVRGGSPDQNLILLDGVTVYNPTHLGGFLSTFNSDAISNVRLIKGGFPAEYGGRLSSVVELTMREGTKEKISGTAGVSLINSRLTLEGPISQDVSFMLSGRRMYLDLIVLAAAPKDEPVPSYYFYDLNAKLNFKLGESDKLYLSGYFGRDVFSLEEEDRRYDPNTHTDTVTTSSMGIGWGNSTGNLRWSHIVSPEVFTNFSAIYTDYRFYSAFEDNSSGDGGNFTSLSGIRDFTLRGEAQYFHSDEHTFKTGFDATLHRFHSGATTSFKELEDLLKLTPNIINSIDASVYLQDEWKAGASWSGNVGGRIYYFQEGNYVRAEPRIALAYAANDALTFKTAFSVDNQFLHLITKNDVALPTDLWFPSTKNVLPSEAWQAILGFESNIFGEEYFFSVEGYYKHMKNLYEYKDTAQLSFDIPIESSFTAGTGDAYGVEVFLNKRLGAFTGWLGYTLAWTTRKFPELNQGREFYPRYDMRHDVSAVLTYRLGKSWEFGMSWMYSTGQAYTVPVGQYQLAEPEQPPYYYNDNSELDFNQRNNSRLPAFHKLDLNFTHLFQWFDLDWQFSINVYNAYNHRNTFGQTVRQKYIGSYEGNSDYKYVIHRFTLFPIIPTFGLSVKF